MASEGLHEAADKLKSETIDVHRAIVSLKEELEAIDWYRQRADAATDAQLRAVLEHNMNEEIEHASMALEWLRRHVPKFDEALRTYLFTTGDITDIEAEAEKAGAGSIAAESGRSTKRATIGGMKGN